jgi:hypothetical protein
LIRKIRQKTGLREQCSVTLRDGHGALLICLHCISLGLLFSCDRPLLIPDCNPSLLFGNSALLIVTSGYPPKGTVPPAASTTATSSRSAIK